VRRGVPALGRAVAGLSAGLLPPRLRTLLTAHTLGAVRRAKILDWHPEPLALPVTLFKTADTARRHAGYPDDLGWAALAKDLRVIPVEGDHGTYATLHLTTFAAAVTEAASSGRSLPRAA
jgi:hypothetical protein